MFTVPAISRMESDGWGVPESGLPIRVVHCAMAAGACTLGELRMWPDERLLDLRSLGVRSLKAIRSFYKALSFIEMGGMSFQGAEEAITFHLSPLQWHVIDLRYGLHRENRSDLAGGCTLQEIANERGVTRERIRQTQEDALARLRSRLARHCLSPVVERLRRFAGEAGGACPLASFAQWPERVAYAGDLDPVSLARLMAGLYPDRLSLRNGCICDLAQDALDPALADAEAFVARADRAVGLEEVAGRIRGRFRLPMTGPRRNGLATLLAHAPSLIATCDARFAGRGALDALLGDLPAAAGGGAPYGQWAREFNQRVQPGSRMTDGAMLAHLSSSPRYAREGRGIYRLAASAGRNLTAHAAGARVRQGA